MVALESSVCPMSIHVLHVKFCNTVQAPRDLWHDRRCRLHAFRFRSLKTSPTVGSRRPVGIVSIGPMTIHAFHGYHDRHQRSLDMYSHFIVGKHHILNGRNCGRSLGSQCRYIRGIYTKHTHTHTLTFSSLIFSPIFLCTYIYFSCLSLSFSVYVVSHFGCVSLLVYTCYVKRDLNNTWLTMTSFSVSRQSLNSTSLSFKSTISSPSFIFSRDLSSFTSVSSHVATTCSSVISTVDITCIHKERIVLG